MVQRACERELNDITVDDDALEKARKQEKLFKDINVDSNVKSKSLDIKKRMKYLDNKIKRMQSFKEFFNG